MCADKTKVRIGEAKGDSEVEDPSQRVIVFARGFLSSPDDIYLTPSVCGVWANDAAVDLVRKECMMFIHTFHHRRTLEFVPVL